jgi:hypothetical protein
MTSVLYRGFYNPRDKTYFKETPKQNRKPLNLTPIKNNIVNKIIENCGLVANRSNSFFVTHSIDTAEYYGNEDIDNVYVCFPVNGFKYTWSPSYADIFGDFEKMCFDITKEELDYNDPSDEYMLKIFNRISSMTKSMKNNIFRGDDNSLKKAIQSEHEIMIHGDCYFLSYNNIEYLD